MFKLAELKTELAAYHVIRWRCGFWFGKAAALVVAHHFRPPGFLYRHLRRRKRAEKRWGARGAYAWKRERGGAEYRTIARGF